MCFEESKIKLLAKMMMKDGVMKFNMRIKNNDNYMNSDFIARFILDIIIQWLVSCISLISINI